MSENIKPYKDSELGKKEQVAKMLQNIFNFRRTPHAREIFRPPLEFLEQIQKILYSIKMFILYSNYYCIFIFFG